MLKFSPLKKGLFFNILDQKPIFWCQILEFDCQCECGNKIKALSNTLISGRKNSCGCTIENRPNFFDLYYLKNNEGNTIYVGQTGKPFSIRLSDHVKRPLPRVIEYLKSGGTIQGEVVINKVPQDYINALEAKIIKDLSEKQPLLNIIHNTDKFDYRDLFQNNKLH